MKESDTIKTAFSTEVSLSPGRSFLLRALRSRTRRLVAISRFNRSVTIGADCINPGGDKKTSREVESQNSSSIDFLRPQDLKPGYVVELADDKRYVVVLDQGRHALIPCSKTVDVSGRPEIPVPLFLFRWGASPAMTRIV
jgi:hypothetical protein